MIPLREAGAEAIADAWNRSVAPRYRIDAALVRQNLLDHPLLHDEASTWHEDSFVAIKRSAARVYEGPDPEVAHLALLNRPDDNPPIFPLLHAAETLRAEGCAAIVVGQDSGHFLAGTPTDVPWMGGFLRKHGFVAGGLAFDLERDLSSGEQRVGSGEPFSPPAAPQSSFRTLADADVPALDNFLARSFPGRWRFDVMRKVKAEGARTVFGLFVNGRCEGFALLQGEGCALPIGGATWRNDLGQSWGSLGPIGIAESIRGGGLGAHLLHQALVELRARGARRTIIDWTGLLDFYGAEGFEVTRAYRSYRWEL